MADRAFRILRYRKLRWLYLAGFLAYLHLTFVVFITSSFFGDIVGEKFVGIIYILGALGSLSAFFGASRILGRFGNYRALVLFTALEMAALLGIAITESTPLLLVLGIIHLSLAPAIFFSLDVFVENYSHPGKNEEDRTGAVRGVYLAIANGAFVIAPLLMGSIVGTEEHFRNVYFLSTFLLIPFLVIIALKFRRFTDPVYQKIGLRNIIPVLQNLKRTSNLYGVFGAHYILRLFYAWSIVYLPIYLHQHIGFNWIEIGVILTLTLTPYMLLEIPIGRIADKYLGEKEIMVVGFLILSASLASVALFTEKNLILWVLIILLAEVGATLLEITTESYFFKQIDGGHASTISLFRMIQPIAYITGITMGTILLFVMPLRFTFIIFGALILIGIRFALMIKDTR